MIQAGYKNTHPVMDEAIAQANRILKNEIFYVEIQGKNHFDMSTASPTYIADRIMFRSKVLVCNVHLYHKRWSKALGYFLPSKPDRIYVNTAKLNRSQGSIVASLIHEFVHLVDGDDKNHSYGHGSNSRAGKQNTAPYWIDNIAQAICDNVQPDFNNEESSKIIVKRSFIQKVIRFFRRLF